MPLNNTQTKVVQAAGDAIFPPAGTVITQLLAFFGIRGKTQHLSYPEADQQAHLAANQIQPLWRANLTAEEYTFVSQNYLPRVYLMLTSRNPTRYGVWWDAGTLPANVNAANLNQTDVDTRVNLALFYHLFWIFFNSDVESVQDDFLRFWSAQVNVIFSDKPSLVSTVSQIQQGTYVPNKETLTKSNQGLVLAGVAGLAAWILIAKPKGL